MIENNCSELIMQRWAEVIVEHCTQIKPEERVEISGEVTGKPLLLALYHKCLDIGAYPVLRPSFPESSEIFYKYANTSQLTHVHPVTIMDAKNTNVSLHVLAETNTKTLSKIDPSKVTLVRKARNILQKIRKERIRWNVTSFPTEAYAQDAGMSLMEFKKFVYEAGYLTTPNPLQAWQTLRTRQQRMTNALQHVRNFRIITPCADLIMSVDGRRICESSGAVNMPDGEIYTGPEENSVNGFIQFSFPGYYMGQVVENIRLEFRKGKVVKASAESNEEFLMKMLDADPGARRIGELGIGTNWGVSTFTKNLLFDEKMGGTIHLALGDGYRETLSKNRSAIHWDILHNLRENGILYADNEILIENGTFQGRYAEIWNDGA